MNKHFIAAICAVLFLSFTLSSCDTPTGQGAGWGAATGALIGAAATGDAEGAAVGAGIGAATGALIGAAVEADERGYYEGRPVAVILMPQPSGTIRVSSTARTAPHNIVDVRGIPHGALVRDPSSGGIFRKP